MNLAKQKVSVCPKMNINLWVFKMIVSFRTKATLFQFSPFKSTQYFFKGITKPLTNTTILRFFLFMLLTLCYLVIMSDIHSLFSREALAMVTNGTNNSPPPFADISHDVLDVSAAAASPTANAGDYVWNNLNNSNFNPSAAFNYRGGRTAGPSAASTPFVRNQR